MNILIVGANFENKGSQSMLFTCVSCLRDKWPNCKIYYKSTDKNVDCNIFKFDFLAYNQYIARLMVGNVIMKVIATFLGVINAIKIGKPIKSVFELISIIKKIDVIIDISGYQLGSNWSKDINNEFLNNITVAKRYKIPIFIMPQSFGPFEYDDKAINKRIKNELPYVSIIYAREDEGYRLLTGKYGLTNVRKAPDIVLVNSKINIGSIYKKAPVFNIPEIVPNSVGIIPNMRSFEKNNCKEILKLYYDVIDLLVKRGKTVYLFRHSIEDIMICEKIKKMFNEENKVILLKQDFSCIEFDKFVQKFDFVVASRFHSVVHSYKNSIPCIVLGWAIKYQELCKIMKQEKYVFNIYDCDKKIQIQEAITYLNENLEYEKKIINEQIDFLKKEYNCFDEIIGQIEGI